MEQNPYTALQLLERPLSAIGIFIRKHLVIILTVLTLAVIFYVIFTYSFISFTVETKGTSPLTIKLIEQKSGKETTIETSDKTVKRFVKRGGYEVFAFQDNATGMVVTRATGFLRTTNTQIKMAPENAREIIGENPSPCLELIQTTLISFSCSGSFQNAEIHKPAVGSQPTYLIRRPENPDYEMRSTVTTKNGTFVLFNAISPDGIPSYLITKINSSLDITEEYLLDTLDTEKEYSMSTYKDGFLVYDDSFNEFYYYTDLTQQPQVIEISRPENPEYVPVFISTTRSSIVLSYITSQEETIDEEFDAKFGTSEVVVYANESEKRYIFEGAITYATTCAKALLCTRKGERMIVYNVQQSTPEKVYEISSVQDIVDSDNEVLIIHRLGVIKLNPEKASGHVIYAFEESEYCGLNFVSSGFIACVQTGQDRLAVQVNTSRAVGNVADRTYRKIKQLPGVNDVSMYKNTLYITPEAPFIYNPLTDANEPDLIALKDNYEQIQAGLAGLGSELEGYTITYAYQTFIDLALGFEAEHL